MRITIPVSGDGDAWMSHLLEFDVDPAKFIGADGRLVVSEAVRFFAHANDFCAANGLRPTFMTSADDGYNVYSMTIEFLRQLVAVTRWIESRPDAKAYVSSDGSGQDRRLERHMARNYVAFCRVDVVNSAAGVKFLVGWGNPREVVVGNCERGARECAIYVTRILLNLAETVNAIRREKRGGLGVEVVGRNPGLVDEARLREEIGRARDRAREANERRVTCVRRLGGYCSPSDPGCPCYRDGRCVEVELPTA